MGEEGGRDWERERGGGGGREEERERETERDRERETDSERERERESGRQTDRQRRTASTTRTFNSCLFSLATALFATAYTFRTAQSRVKTVNSSKPELDLNDQRHRCEQNLSAEFRHAELCRFQNMLNMASAMQHATYLSSGDISQLNFSAGLAPGVLIWNITALLLAENIDDPWSRYKTQSGRKLLLTENDDLSHVASRSVC